MLSNADLDLVARDRSLPGLATLLDTAAFTEVLRGASPAFVRATVHPRYVRYKPGTRCLVAYDVRVADSRLPVHASAYSPGRWAEKVAGDAALSTSSILVHDRALVIKVFPEDARLRVVKRLWDPATRLPLLRKLLPEHDALHSASIETLAYNPERRYVGLLKGEGRLAVIKLYADSVFVQARAAAGRQRRAELLRTPRCIGRSRRHRALALEWLPGERLTDLLATSTSLDEHMHRAGRALAELHQHLRLTTIGGSPVEQEGILTEARAIRALWPGLGDRADRLASTIAHALGVGTAFQPIHGDFYAAQVLIDDERVGILDLDRARSGDPMSDVGNFVAHLEYAVVDGSLSPTMSDLAIDAFIKGYEQTAGTSVGDRIHTHVAAALFRLGSRPFRTRAADWTDRLSAILDRIDIRIPHRSHLPRHTAIERDHVPGPFDTLNDPELGLAEEALDVESVAHRLAHLPPWRSRTLTISAIRVVRHKPGRRCLIEYDIELDNAGGATRRVTAIGKVKKKGADRQTFELMRALWQRGFNPDDDSGISVPEPIGVFPEWKMWLQLKVAGTTAGSLLGGHHTSMLGRRAAEVVHKIQRTNIAAARTHTAGDELGILRERLSKMAIERPIWKRRLETLVDGCTTLLASLSTIWPCAVHRDFHPGQLIIDGHRVHLLDFDLYAAGDPGLDIGNFLAHVAEWSIRELGDPAGLSACEMAVMDRFVELEPSVDRRRLDVYRLVSLARHVHISTTFPDRQAFTERILEYCEDQLALALSDGIGSSSR